MADGHLSIDATGPPVFLSYARADQARAARLAAVLAGGGLDVWWDARIEGGAEFAEAIRVALDRAEAVVVLWSRASVGSDWVRDEAATGRDRRRLVPVSLDGSAPPLGFRQYHALDFSKWRGREDCPELAALRRAIAALAGAAPAPSTSPARSAVSRRGVLAFGAGAAALAGGGVWAWREWGQGAPAPGSILVLPFKNLSGDPAQGYFSAGLTEAVRSTLARNDRLRVLAATTSQAAASGGDAAAIARSLNVAYVLEGSVQRAGPTMRVATALSDSATGFNLWSSTVDRPVSAIFRVQTDIANTVARALQVRVATADPLPGGTTSVPAYEAYLQGRALFDAARDEASDRAALAQYDVALGLDQRFAMAHAARSRSLAGIAAEYASTDERRVLTAAAVLAARRAVDLAPELAAAHLALGYALFTGALDAKAARASYDRAASLGQGDADVLLLFALYCARARRRGDADAAIGQAVALDPLNPRAFRAQGSIGYAARRYDAAIASLRRALRLNPAITNAQALIGSCLYAQGRLAEARAAWAAEPHEAFRLTGLAIVDRRLGHAAAADASFARLRTEAGNSALYQQAQVLAQWDRPGEALVALERARALGDSGLLYLTTDPMLDPIARDARFGRLARGMGLA